MRATTTPPSRTRIVFDLVDILTPEEIAAFEANAGAAQAPSLTEHFLNITLRKSPQPLARCADAHHQPTTGDIIAGAIAARTL